MGSALWMVNARVIDSEGNKGLDKQVVFESEVAH